MSDKMTVISVPGRPSGDSLMDWGDKTTAEMISFYRAYAARLRSRAEAIEKMSDEDFRIEIVRGRVVQHPIKVLQEGRLP